MKYEVNEVKSRVLAAISDMDKRGIDVTRSYWDAERPDDLPDNKECKKLFGCDWTDILRMALTDTIRSFTGWRLATVERRREVILETMREMCPTGEKLSYHEWDKQKPHWMPTSRAIAYSMNTKWTTLCREAGLKARAITEVNTDDVCRLTETERHKIQPSQLNLGPEQEKYIWLGQGMRRRVTARLVI